VNELLFSGGCHIRFPLMNTIKAFFHFTNENLQVFSFYLFSVCYFTAGFFRKKIFTFFCLFVSGKEKPGRK